MPFLHRPLVGVVDHPALLKDLGSDPLGLLHALHQALDRDVGLGRVGARVGLEKGRKGFRSMFVQVFVLWMGVLRIG